MTPKRPTDRGPPERVLLVLAHPLPDSFNAAIARTVAEVLGRRGYHVDVLDLYAEDFDPRLSAAERAAYNRPGYDPAAVRGLVERLQGATKLVFVFPQWWFNLPAILKGFFDRIFVPGVAFDHAPDGDRLIPRLDHVRAIWAVTTTGSPWLVTELYMGNPVRRQLKRGVGAFCARGLSFRMLTLYDMDRATLEKRQAFLRKVAGAFEAF